MLLINSIMQNYYIVAFLYDICFIVPVQKYIKEAGEEILFLINTSKRIRVIK